MNDTLVIIPAYNEELCIGEILQKLEPLKLPVDLVVIDDGSHDHTAAIVGSYSVKVISHSFNLGYGAAIQTGFKYAIAAGYQYALQFDADGQHDPDDLITLLNILRNNPVDLVIGSRFLGTGTMKVGSAKKLIISLLRFIICFFTGQKISDPTSGFKGTRRVLFQYYAGMGNFPADFPDADVLIRTLRAGFRIREIPANIGQRLAGESMYIGWKPFYYVIRLFVAITVAVLQEKTVHKGDEILHG